MKALRGRYTVKLPACAAAMLLSLCLLPLRAQDEAAPSEARDPEAAKTMYLQAYSLTSRANDMRDKRDWKQALSLYEGAADIYRLLIEQYPEWKPDVVANLDAESRQQIALVERMLAPEKKDAGTAAPSAAAPTDTPAAPTAAAPDLKLKGEIEKLKLDNNGLRRLVERLKGEQKQALAQYEQTMKERLQPLLSENEDLRKRLQAFESGGAVGDGSLSKRIVSLSEENLALNEQLTQALASLRDLRAREIGFAKLAESHDKLAAENKDLRKSVEEGYGAVLEEQKETWRRKFAELQEAFNKSEADLRRQSEELADALDKSRSDLEKRAARVAELEAANSEMKKSLADLKDFDSQLKKRTEEIDALTAQLSRREERIAELADENNKLAQQLKSLEQASNDLEKSRAQAESLRAELAARDEKLADLSAENSSLADRIEELRKLEGRLAKRDAEVESLRGELAERDLRLADMKEINSQLDGSLKQAAKLEKENKELNLRIEELLAEQAAELAELEEECSNRLEREQERQAELKEEHSAKEAAWKDERARMVAIMDEKYAEILAERDRLAEELKALSGAQQTIAKQTEEISRLVAGVAELKERHQARLAELEDSWVERLRQSDAAAAADAQATRDALQAARERLETIDDDWQARQRGQVEQWKAKFAEMEALLQSQKSELDAQAARMAEMKKVYEESEVGRVVARYEDERARQAKQNALIREALASLKAERDAISAEKFETERKLLELEGEYRRLQKKVAEE